MGTPGLVVPFGRYVLQERLAQGGMGEVFRAVAVGEHGFEKPVVVKRVLPAHAGREELADLFVAEAKLMTRLAHPNIVGVLDFGRGEHRDYYLVLELVDGVDLGRLLRAYAARPEPFPVPLALFIASQVLRGLHHAHTRSAGEGAVIVHRDVSPSNVLCSAEGEVKVADFGVALVTRAARAGSEGGAGAAGKPGYMAPEQFDGGAVDPRADVFSAGVVLYQMLTGELPFQGETPEAQQAAARRGERERAGALRAEVSEEIEAILAQALAPSADARFADAKAMAQAVEGLRDRGQRIATGDDVAEAVRAAQRALPPPGRRVIALSGASAEPSSDSVEEEPSELTRTAVPGGGGAFTLRFPVRADATTQGEGASPAPAHAPDRWSKPEPRTERITSGERPLPIEPGTHGPITMSPKPSAPRARSAELDVEAAPSDEGPRQRVLRRGAVAAVVAAALLGVITFANRPAPAPRASAPASSAPAPLPAAPPAPTPAVLPAAAPPEERAGPPSEAPAEAHGSGAAPAPPIRAEPPGRAPQAAPSSRATGSPTPTVSAPAVPSASVAPADDCIGDVAIWSDGAFLVTGGPRTVESPAKAMKWPCGSYQLTARSRFEPVQVKNKSITVAPNHPVVVDLR